MARKLKVGRGNSEQLRKSKKLLCKIPKDIKEKIDNELMEKYSVNSYQAIFDYLVISGVVYFNREIIGLIDDNISEFIERDKLAKLARLKKCDPPEYPDYHSNTFHMYPKDFKGFKDFVIEKNYSQQWVFEILFREFAKENPIIVDFLKRGKDLDVRKRKKQVARLSEDEWVKRLSEDDSKIILAQLTENYDNNKFSEHLQAEIDKFLETAQTEADEGLDEEEIEFLKRLESSRMSRSFSIRKISNRRELPDETEEIVK